VSINAKKTVLPSMLEETKDLITAHAGLTRFGGICADAIAQQWWQKFGGLTTDP
jgi:hypothetical protein